MPWAADPPHTFRSPRPPRPLHPRTPRHTAAVPHQPPKHPATRAHARPARTALVRVLACAWLALPWALASPNAAAGSLAQCQTPVELTAPVQDRLIRVAALVKAELAQSGREAAIVSRSGQALDWLGHRYSHAGVSLRDNGRAPWAVRQLYFACDDERPRVFDQGMSGFVMGVHDAAQGRVSVILLPPQASDALARAALSDEQALRVLGPDYSASAYAFSTLYQNCNQWLAELMAMAWAPAPPATGPSNATNATGTTPATLSTPPPAGPGPQAHGDRVRAQQWLRDHGYQPSTFTVRGPMRWLASLSPLLPTDDHPSADAANGLYRVSMPAAIEAFARVHWPDSTRVEFCHTDRYAVIRRGWEPLPDGCQPGPGDEVVDLTLP